MRAHPRLRRPAGLLITAGSLTQLVAAFLPDSRVFTSADPRARLEAIAARPAGWRAQAVGFPVAFAVTGLGFAVAAASMPDRRSRRLAVVASALGLASVLLWLPISARRLELGRHVDELLREETVPAADIGGWSFWPYTVAALGSILTMGCALAVSRLHRRLGATAAAVSGLALVLAPRWGDWPPFLSYLITLGLGLGLAAGAHQANQADHEVDRPYARLRSLVQ